MPTKRNPVPNPQAETSKPKSGPVSKATPAGRTINRVEKGDEITSATVYAGDQRAETQGGETTEPTPFKLQKRDTCPYCSSPMPSKIVPIAPDDPKAPLPSIPAYLLSVPLIRSQAEQILGTMMSQISKRCYDSRWITGTETTVPHLAEIAVKTDVPQRWGKDGVTVDEAKSVVALRDALGYVVTENPQAGGAAYIPYRPANREKGQANGED